MKKALLFAIAASISIGTFAQKARIVAAKDAKIIDDQQYAPATAVSGTAAKTTAVGDTVFVSHIDATPGVDTVTLYSFVNDSGRVFGTNAFGDKGYAERYDVNPATTSYKVIGVRALFGGSITPASTKTITFNVWAQGPKSVSFRPTVFNNGLPSTSLASGVKSITDLGIGIGATDADTTRNHLFATPTAYLSDSFFVGYTMNYTWTSLSGDTIGLYSNRDNERGEPGYFAISTSDTDINNVNVTMNSAGAWKDNGQELYGIFNNLNIFPIVIIGPGTGAAGSITRRDFTFYGNFPNPASNSTNVKIALANSADVTIDISDMSGRSISQITKNNLTAGEHMIELNTSSLPSGEYIYTIHTSAGDGIASVLTVIR